MRWLLLLFFATLSASTTCETHLGVGWRYDHLRWAISGGRTNILSELTYRDLHTVQVVGGLEACYCNRFVARLEGAGGYLYRGRDQDSDYGASHRQEEFSRSYSDIDGYTADLSFDLGVIRRAGPLSLVPRLGIAWHRLYFRGHDGIVVIPDVYPLGLGISSTYRADWVALFNSLELRWCGPRNLLGVEGKLNYGGYIGEADWRLRPDLDSMNDYAVAYGCDLDVQWRFSLRRCLCLFVKGGIKYWFIGEGTHHWRGRGRQGAQNLYDTEWFNGFVTVGLVKIW